jgi:subtilase family serine protease
MLHRFFLSRVAAAVALLIGMVPAMQGAVQSRIVGGAGKTMVALPDSVSPRASRATDLGAADGGSALTSMTLRFSMTDAQKASLTQLLEDQQNPASPKYRQWLTPEQFAAQFGLSAADIATVSDWLTAQGFQITATARSATFIQFSGTVAQAQAAFQTSIHRVSLDGEEHLANVTAVSLPSGIAAVVGSVGGLNDFRLKPRARVRSLVQLDPKFTSNGSHYIAPEDFSTIYDVKPLLNSSINGSGITIAVAGQTDIALSDVSAFRSATGLSTNLPTVKLYGTDPGTQSNDVGEADLDVEWSGAVAPSASILYVNSTNVINSLIDIIDNKLAPIASISYGDCESGTGASEINTLNQAFMQANAEGITIIGPAGDAGATDCDYGTTRSAIYGLAVDFPASSPYVTGLGGTMFNELSGSYWSTTTDSNGGSALSYIPEAVWNESTTDITGNSPQLGAGGGGSSLYFTKPSWQTGTGVPNDSSRDVPDLSLNAAANHDGYLICTQGSCGTAATSGCPTGGCFGVVGGTSVSTPSFAAILALVEQKIGSTTGVGNANPTIYALANSKYSSTVFHDVTQGNNDSPCTVGTPNCTNGSEGYSATTGYDLASGWGSVDAFVLANSWALVTPGSGSTGTASTTTVTASSASVTSGTTVTITATVSGAASSGSPTGTVQFLVDNVDSGTAVTLSGGVATFALGTAGLTSGSHVISAAYSGDSVYAASKGSVTVDVVSATSADFTLTPATATVTTAAGTDASGLVFTVTPTNGFTGSVAFSASTTSSTLNASYAFSVTPVSITSTAAGTTTFTLSAYTSSASATPGTYTILVTATGTDGGVTVTHSSTVTFVVTAPTSSSASFTLSPATATVTTASGTTAPGLVFTVTPTNGFTGSVAFTAGTSSSTLNATYSFSANPVTITSTAAGTTTLTLSAFGANGAAVLGKGRVPLRPAGSASAEPPAGLRRGWVAGSGAAFACVVLLMLPRRRKFGALLGAVVAVAALGGMLGMSGCGGGTSTVTTNSNNTTPGTYTITVTATGTTTAGAVLPVQTSTVTFVVQ